MNKNTVIFGPVIINDNRKYIIEIHSKFFILKLLSDYLEEYFENILYKECFLEVYLKTGEEVFLQKAVKKFCSRFDLEFIDKNIFDST